MEKYVPQWSSKFGNHVWGGDERWPSIKGMKDFAAEPEREKDGIRLDGFWRLKEIKK